MNETATNKFDEILNEYLQELGSEQTVISNSVKDDIKILIENPKVSMGAKYHDAASCWELIDGLLDHIRNLA